MSFQFRWEQTLQRWLFYRVGKPESVYKIVILLLAAPFLWACQPEQSTPTMTNAPELITPYWTPTSSPTTKPRQSPDSQTPTAIPATVPPPPTPTPFTYVVEKGDTMGVIAYRFGVTVADLKTANPEVDPNLMSVGTVLVIPIVEKNEAGTPQALASPTPIPVQIDQPNCYPVTSGGAWCLALAHNDQGQPLENLIAWIQLTTSDGEVLAGQQAIPPLNLLPTGQSLPVMAYFPDYPSTGGSAQAELLSALLVPSGDQRYRPTEFQIEQTEISPDGLEATVQGTLTLLALPTATTGVENQAQSTPEPSPTPTAAGELEENTRAGQVWLAVIAYNESNLPVGVRKWEATMDFTPGARLPFKVTVYSLGPMIARVDVLVEAGY